MKHLIRAVSIALSLTCSLAWAADEAPSKKEPSAAQLAQQEKMKNCNKEAGDKELKGDERKAFMKTCLSAKPAPQTTQRDKMKVCNDQAGEKALKGDDRKAFMSECLKK